jgi:hypothetical protein
MMRFRETLIPSGFDPIGIPMVRHQDFTVSKTASIVEGHSDYFIDVERGEIALNQPVRAIEAASSTKTPRSSRGV